MQLIYSFNYVKLSLFAYNLNIVPFYSINEIYVKIDIKAIMNLRNIKFY